MKSTVIEQRLGLLRQAVISARDGLRQYEDFRHLADELDRVIRDDNKLADTEPTAPDEVFSENYAYHMRQAFSQMRNLLSITGAQFPELQECLEHVVAAAEYGALMRLRREAK